MYRNSKSVWICAFLAYTFASNSSDSVNLEPVYEEEHMECDENSDTDYKFSVIESCDSSSPDGSQTVSSQSEDEDQTKVILESDSISEPYDAATNPFNMDLLRESCARPGAIRDDSFMIEFINADEYIHTQWYSPDLPVNDKHQRIIEFYRQLETNVKEAIYPPRAIKPVGDEETVEEDGRELVENDSEAAETSQMFFDRFHEDDYIEEMIKKHAVLIHRNIIIKGSEDKEDRKIKRINEIARLIFAREKKMYEYIFRQATEYERKTYVASHGRDIFSTKLGMAIYRRNAGLHELTSGGLRFYSALEEYSFINIFLYILDDFVANFNRSFEFDEQQTTLINLLMAMTNSPEVSCRSTYIAVVKMYVNYLKNYMDTNRVGVICQSFAMLNKVFEKTEIICKMILHYKSSICLKNDTQSHASTMSSAADRPKRKADSENASTSKQMRCE